MRFLSIFSRGGFFFIFIFLYLRKRMREKRKKRERKEKEKRKKSERKGKELWNCNTTYVALPPVWDSCCVGFFLSSLVDTWEERRYVHTYEERQNQPQLKPCLHLLSLSLSLSLLCRLCGLLDPWVLDPGSWSGLVSEGMDKINIAKKTDHLFSYVLSKPGIGSFIIKNFFFGLPAYDDGSSWLH